jgi:hypothetical protein
MQFWIQLKLYVAMSRNLIVTAVCARLEVQSWLEMERGQAKIARILALYIAAYAKLSTTPHRQ